MVAGTSPNPEAFGLTGLRKIFQRMARKTYPM